MNKELIERSVAATAEEMDSFDNSGPGPGIHFFEPAELTEFSTLFLARIDAERGKDAVAWLHESRREADVITTAVKNVWGGVAVGNMAAYSIPLFLSPTPTIPEGWALYAIPAGRNSTGKGRKEKKMDKQLVERIALEALDSFKSEDNDPEQTDRESVAEFAAHFLARIDAERGKEAVAWRTETGYSQPEYLYHSLPPIRSKGDPLFLSPTPTIPEGWALVSVEQIEALVDYLHNPFEPSNQPKIYERWVKLLAAAQGERK